jgi:hypothetical protein
MSGVTHASQLTRGRLVGLLVGTGALLGCFLTTEPADSVDLQVAVIPTNLRIGDSASVIVSLTNRRSSPIEFQTSGCPVHFAVFGDDGRMVAPSSLGCVLVPQTVSLAAEEERRYRFTWLGEPWSNWRPHYGPYPTEFLEPGAYTVRGVLPLESRDRLSSPVSVELLSPD